jgi:hypothetical protein
MILYNALQRTAAYRTLWRTRSSMDRLRCLDGTCSCSNVRGQESKGRRLPPLYRLATLLVSAGWGATPGGVHSTGTRHHACVAGDVVIDSPTHSRRVP